MRHLRWLAGVLALALGSSLIVGVPQAQAAPMAMQNWVVSASGFRTDAYRNYIRLGYIVFSPTGNTVEHNFWTWNQADDPAAVPSGEVYYCSTAEPGTNPRNNCGIKVPPGFTGPPNGRFTGTYAYNEADQTVTITWTRSTVDGTTTPVELVETWKVGTHRAGLGRMRLSGDNYSLTSGIGYGSNAGLDQGSRAPMSTVGAKPEPLLMEGQSWNRNTITDLARGDAGGLTMNDWQLCDDGSCLGHVQYNAGCSASSCCPQGPGYEECVDRLEASGNRRFYYLTDQFGGRRNAYEFWCECLSYDACYTRNSHIRPLLQVIDSDGQFRGWVGAEISTDRTAPRDMRGEFYAAFALIE